MKKYTRPETVEITLKAQGMLAISNGNEEGEGEYSRKRGGNDAYSGFGKPLWSDM